ncbi:putative flavin-nucleotide-binding protein structurally related to pyridoxine 5'-phosphate oxidase [Mesorhizobium sp. J18]|uniref:pyridoxamine 5'-phosphate oxidase family protein n=1 Tax=Mesorhizobium sp. J18 TaxID=935263 RepID=UPI00119AD841|nr:pyridoxamine 5'-phosphate oxidase family protein [Mesorhizobium sp. J18]TWG95956.1 putative flavin-nucleotide-binding protein structurally related to pyridoxine 5'-phosphate oxidase [Mesorhizobium sp. J18]
MGLSWQMIPDDMRAFIEAQKLFFVATAPKDGRVNLSPKGLDTLRVLDERTVVYLDLTGSGNETAAHVTENGRMTMMFCAFSGKPMTLRLYGKAELIRPDHGEWPALLSLFPEFPGVRQVFRLHVDSAATSCGWGVPLVGEMNERDELIAWSSGQSEDEIEAYRLANNVVSIDGLPTGYVSDDF